MYREFELTYNYNTSQFLFDNLDYNVIFDTQEPWSPAERLDIYINFEEIPSVFCFRIDAFYNIDNDDIVIEFDALELLIYNYRVHN